GIRYFHVTGVQTCALPIFGHLVSDGYRVVYESTKILSPEQIDLENDTRFLQATNISSDGLWIEVENIGFVSVRDWDRYPKGRIRSEERRVGKEYTYCLMSH